MELIIIKIRKLKKGLPRAGVEPATFRSSV